MNSRRIVFPNTASRSLHTLILAAIALAPLPGQTVATFFNRNIPQECHEKMISFRNAGHTILSVAFPPAGGNSWSIVTDKSFFNRNIPQECHDKMFAFYIAGHQIQCVAFPPGGGNSWSIITDQSFYNRNIPQECHDKMVTYHNSGHTVLSVAFPPAGGNSWSIITDQSFFNRNVPQECHERMIQLHNAGHRNRWVAYPPAGGNRWSVITDKGYYNRNVLSEAHSKMGGMMASPGALRLIAYTQNGIGFSVVSHVPEVSIASATSQIYNVTASTIFVSGVNLDRVSKVFFGGINISSTDASDPTKAYYKILSPTQLRVHTQQGMSTGNYSLRVESDWSVSNDVTVALIKNVHPRLLVAPKVLAGDKFSIYVAAGDNSAAQAFLAFSVSNVPSVLPGIVSLGIGNAFTQVRLLPVSVGLPASSRAGRFDLQSVPSLLGTSLHFQAVYFTRMLPLPVSNVGSTTFQ